MSCPHSPTDTHDAASCPAVRPELGRPLPVRMRKLSVDARGYPVPWFVHWLADGTPDHRVMSSERWSQAISERLCWTCGEKLGKFVTFAIGPMCGVNRTTTEPGNHLECAIWSAQNCPFLARPHAHRRDVDPAEALLNDLNTTPPGYALARNPGVVILWTTTDWRIWQPDVRNTPTGVRPPNPGPLLRIGDPVALRAYRAGVETTREEVDSALVTGLPALVDVAMKERDGVAHLDGEVARFRQLLDRFVV